MEGILGQAKAATNQAFLNSSPFPVHEGYEEGRTVRGLWWPLPRVTGPPRLQPPTYLRFAERIR